MRISRDTVIQLVSSELDAEISAGFPRVRLIPDTEVQRFLEVWKGLSSNEKLQRRFVSSHQVAAFIVGDDSPPDPAFRENNRWFADRMVPLYSDLRFIGVRQRRLALALRDQLPNEISEALDSRGKAESERNSDAEIIPAKAKEIRKALRPLLLDRFAAKAENVGGGVWFYSGKFQGKPLVISVDYGGMSAQMRYALCFDGLGNQGYYPSTNLEKILGVGFGDWDLLTTTNLQANLELLCHLIADAATFLGKIKSLIDHSRA